MIIAIDGPAAAGKGTLSRRIAEQYGFHHLDTGLTYRATAKALLDAGLPLDDEAAAEKVAAKVDLAGLDRTILSAHDIGEAASKIAVMPSVRRALVAAQQAFSRKTPGTVIDGRDIGTVVCPDAPVKFYVTASPEVRAWRRYDEVLAIGELHDKNPAVWVQLGIWNQDAAIYGESKGLTVVMDRCIKIEHARFHGGLHLLGFDTGQITSRKTIR